MIMMPVIPQPEADTVPVALTGSCLGSAFQAPMSQVSSASGPRAAAGGGHHDDDDSFGVHIPSDGGVLIVP